MYQDLMFFLNHAIRLNILFFISKEHKEAVIFLNTRFFSKSELLKRLLSSTNGI